MSTFDFSLTTFSQTGKLPQIEYALNAMQAGATSVGIKTSGGVVLAAEKRLPPLIDETTVQRISSLTSNCGCAYSGMGPDARILVQKAQKAGEQYRMEHQDVAPTSRIVQSLADTMQEYTQSGGVRPFGVSLLVAGIDFRGPELYQVDPSGSFWRWKATALGKGMSEAKSFLEKQYRDDLSVEEAIDLAVKIIREGFEGTLTEYDLEVAVADNETKKFRHLPPDEIKDYIDNIM